MKHGLYPAARQTKTPNMTSASGATKVKMPAIPKGGKGQMAGEGVGSTAQKTR